MPANLILHPSVVAAATQLFRNFAELSAADQIILCTLIQVRAQARDGSPLAESLAEELRIIGEAPYGAPREELDTAKYEVYATLQAIAARERGDTTGVPMYETWCRDIS